MNRRDFLKLSGLSVAAAGSLALGAGKARAVTADLRIKRASEVYTICPYCSVGCGMIAHVADGQLINLEGDPDHPISEGSLCPKGSSAFQFAYNERRLRKALYRKPYESEWKTVEVDWALDQIAQRVKETRDRHFVETEAGVTVNRTEAIANIGSACVDNEEAYLITKLMRALGVVYLEHHARI
ncbi:MAG TPA: twin-arginine translocation signal domain-containing protein [Symbiobacteriaceae bacterium]|nr:twin-arginine translocation signal domain-containing protein [Symbiobacteriaceae bacterium]